MSVALFFASLGALAAVAFGGLVFYGRRFPETPADAARTIPFPLLFRFCLWAAAYVVLLAIYGTFWISLVQFIASGIYEGYPGMGAGFLWGLVFFCGMGVPLVFAVTFVVGVEESAGFWSGPTAPAAPVDPSKPMTPAQYALGLLLLVAAVALSTAAFAAVASLFWFGYEIRAYLSECVFGSTEACRLYTETFDPFD